MSLFVCRKSFNFSHCWVVNKGSALFIKLFRATSVSPSPLNSTGSFTD